MKLRLGTLLFSIFAISLFVHSENTSIDKQQIAKQLVHQVGAVDAGDLVLITGGIRDFELLEDVVAQVQAVGAYPLFVPATDRMDRLYFEQVPAKYDSQPNEFSMKLANMATVFISVDYVEDPNLLSDISPERLAAVSEAGQMFNETLVKRNVRAVNLGNGMYPTAALAKRWNVPIDQLSQIFWKGINTDYLALEKGSQTLREILRNGKEAHITDANGTNLKFQIQGRPIFTSDGSISEEDRKHGGAASTVWLPAGEVYLSPVPWTATEKVVSDNLFWEGTIVEGLTLEYKAGKLISMSARSGIERMQAYYERAGEGKDEFSSLDIGINSDVPFIPNSRMSNFVSAGTVSLGQGNNIFLGGENSSNFGIANRLNSTTLTIDGKVVVENGKLKF